MTFTETPTTVRAKMRCISVTHFKYSSDTKLQWSIKLSAVTSSTKGNPNAEDDLFAGMSPSGGLEFSTLNQRAAEAFTPGQSYYVDITAASAE